MLECATTIASRPGCTTMNKASVDPTHHTPSVAFIPSQ